MSAELIAIIAATITLGGLVTAQIAGLRGRIDRQGEALDARLRATDDRLRAVETNIDAKLRALEASLDERLRAVETELAYLRGLLQGAGFGPVRQPDPPAVAEGADAGAAA